MDSEKVKALTELNNKTAQKAKELIDLFNEQAELLPDKGIREFVAEAMKDESFSESYNSSMTSLIELRTYLS